MKKHDAATKVALGLAAQDLATGTDDKEGDWVSLALYDSLMVVYTSVAGTADEDVTVKLRQATTAAGGSAKDLEAGQWYAAQTAGDTLDTIGTAGTFTDDGETLCLARVEVTGDQLDTANDFEYVQVHCSDPGATAGKLAAVVYFMRGARYVKDVPEQPTVIT